jgi:ATP-dependent DNA helicase RecQ
MMRGYAETAGCRREFLLIYFGEAYTPACGHCDNCDAGQVQAPEEQSRPFPLGSRVVHRTFGGGQVMRYEDDRVTVLFDGQDYHTLVLGLVMENGLLERPDA